MEENRKKNEDREATEVRLIKRYTNRKLYDTTESRYVTLDEISGMVKQGLNVKVVDNRTGEDITDVTLAQIIYEEQKKKVTRMPLEFLREIITTRGAAVGEFLHRRVTQPVMHMRDEAERRVDALVRRSEQTVEDSARQIQKFIQSTQKSLDELQQRLGMQSLKDALSTRHLFKQQLQQIRKRIEQLEARLG
ncbi:MAG: transcriptional regulator, partial [Deltaproteobacteria bacterium]